MESDHVYHGSHSHHTVEALDEEEGREEQRTRYLMTEVCLFDRLNHIQESDPRKETVGRMVQQGTTKKDWREQSRRVY